MYLVLDYETENHKEYKRLANPFIDKNWAVYKGWKVQGDKKCSMKHFKTPQDVQWLDIPKKINELIGFNIKFDLLYEWKSPELKAFFKRGGTVWCCQYAEYLLEAQAQHAQMCSLDSIVEKYGGRKKIDEVKLLWKMGKLTSQIEPKLIKDYLIGTKKEKYNSGDIGNTEKVYLGQIKRAEELGMLTMIRARMDGLCATTEMEFNGLQIDVQEAQRRMEILQDELEVCSEQLEQYVPLLPPELEFNWGSPLHRSALIFGGSIKYTKQAMYINPKTGKPARYKAFKEVKDGVYVSGKRKGSPRIRKIETQGELRTRNTAFTVDLPGHIKPNQRWLGKHTDAKGKPVYQTNVDVIDALKNKNIPFLKLMGKRNDIMKDLGTYYIQHDPKKGYTGMLTCVDRDTHIVHHNLNHTTTVTTRMSSDKPNLQNLPKEGKSEVKKMFISRFKNGVMMEADYAQLEVVVQGMLARCKKLCQDLRDGVDFHCKRVSAKFKIPYEEAVDKCKNEKNPEYKIWSAHRTVCKAFSFQRAYGAGAKTISESTGLPKEEIQLLIDSEDRLYPGVVRFNSKVETEVKRTAKAFKQFFAGGGWKIYRRGYWVSPTGTRYAFRTYNAPDWLKKRGVQEAFKPTEMKNYPVQGTAGEIVQIMLGKLWRHFVAIDNYNDDAVLCNTVHDCVWIDTRKKLKTRVAKDVKRIMEDVPDTLKELYGMDVTVPFPISIECGVNLYSQHEV